MKEDALCEVCGRRKAVKQVLIEGAVLNVCSVCARDGKEITSHFQHQQRGSTTPRTTTELDIVDNYGRIIKSRRKEMGLTLKEAARQLNEKEGYLDMIEAERTLPSIRTARKLEKFYGVKLIVERVVEAQPQTKVAEGQPPALTLGDVVVFEKKNDKA